MGGKVVFSPLAGRGLCLLVLAFVALLSALLASPAQAAPLGATGFFGNPSSPGETIGGRFGAITGGASAGSVPMGVAVNDASGDVYVADTGNDRLQHFDADGNFEWALGFDVIAPGKAGNQPQSEVQQVALTGSPTGGSFVLRYPTNADATTSIPFNATAAQVQAALEALGAIAPGDVIVSLAPGGDPGGGSSPGGPWRIEFGGTLADSPIVAINGVSSLTPAGGVGVTVVTEGGGVVEKCTVAADCKAGVPAQGPGNRRYFEVVSGGGVAGPRGIAVNQSTGDLYVSDAGYSRIMQLDEDGNFIRAWGLDVIESGPGQSNEQQRLAVDASSGQYRLNFGVGGPGISETADIAWNAGPAAVQGALEGISNIGTGNVVVTGGPGGTAPYLVTYVGALAGSNVSTMTVSAGTTPLSGGSGATIAILNEGAQGFEICEAAISCDRGVNGFTGGAFPDPANLGYVAILPAGTPDAGNVLVGDASRSRVQEFTATGQFVRAFGFDVAQPAASPSSSAVFEVCRTVALDICKGGVTGGNVGQFATAGGAAPNIRVAADSTGAIYTVEPTGNFRVQKFSPAPGGSLTPSVFNPQIQTLPGETPPGEFPLSGTSAANSPTEIAVDPVDDHIYVVKACTATTCPGPPSTTERRMYEFDAGGALVETHLASYNLPAINGLALKSGGEAAYLSSGAPKAGVYLAGPPLPPHATVGTTTGVTASCATMHGTVNPNGGGALHTFYRFEYRPTGTLAWSSAPPVDADIGSGEAAVPVELTVCGLQPNRDYEVRVVATKGGSPVFSSGSAGNFKTDPAGPAVQTFAAFWDTTSSELVLRGSVNPNNSPTSFYFEYGPVPCSSSTCASVPVGQDGSVGSGGKPVSVSQRVAGLTVDTTYHFRIVADNGVGEEIRGAELTLVTPAATTCTNEQLRRENNSADLPECRAFEWVSKGDSWGSGIGPIMGSLSDDGERSQFAAQAFGQPPSVPGPSTPYVAERTSAGWAVHQMVPPAATAQGSNQGTRYIVAADLGSVLWPQSSLGQRLRKEVRWGTVGIDGSESWVTDLLVPVDHSGAGGRQDEYALKGSANDMSSFVFALEGTVTEVSVALLTGEPLLRKALNSNLYEVRNGALNIANRGAAPSPENPLGLIGGACGAGLGDSVSKGDGEMLANAVSADGSKIHFSARPTAPAAPSPGASCAQSSPFPKRLYKRINGTTTVEISACAKTTPTCTTAGSDRYRGAARDGSVTFFVSPRQLVDIDTDGTEDLYVYDESLPASERLALASAGEAVAGDHPTIGAGAEVQGVLDNAANGSRVYFVAKGRLTPEGTKGANNLYVFERDASHPAGRIAFVGLLAAGEANGTASSFALPNGEKDDGHFLLFTSAAKLSGEDTDSSRDLYRYDDLSESTTCLSCMGEGSFDVKIASRPTEVSWADYEQRARPATDDVSAVVFTTVEGLVDEDLNGSRDVYLWRAGALSLVSAGSGEAGVHGSRSESSISPDGKSVLFITRTGLIGEDRNNGLDLYVSRIGGGFTPRPSAPPACTAADGCLDPPSSTAGPEPGAGSTQPTTGNPPRPSRPCKKGFVRRRGKCVKKSQSGKHRKGGKRSGRNRGGQK